MKSLNDTVNSGFNSFIGDKQSFFQIGHSNYGFYINIMSNKQITQSLTMDCGDLLGKGSTGNVYRGTYRDSSMTVIPVAVKVIPLSEINNEVVGYLLKCQLEALKLTSTCYKAETNGHKEEKQVQDGNIENERLGKNSPAIVQLYDIIVIANNCHIVMQLLEGGTLKEYILQKKKFPQQQAISILTQIISAYKILKDHGIVHRDIKPDNIIFTSSPQNSQSVIPKIIDFGYCQIQSIKKPQMFYNVGSPRYMSPEAYMDTRYSQKSDIWAIGIIFYEMITGTNLDKGKQVKQCFKQIKEKGIPIPSSLSTKAKKLLQMMLMFDPAKRSDCENILAALNEKQGEGSENQDKRMGSGEKELRTVQKNGFIRQSLGNFQPRRESLLEKNISKNTSIEHSRSESTRLVRSGIFQKHETPPARLSKNPKPELVFKTILKTNQNQQKIFTSELKTPDPHNYNPPHNSNKTVGFAHKEPHPIRINKERQIRAQPQQFSLNLSSSQRNLNQVRSSIEKNQLVRISDQQMNGVQRQQQPQQFNQCNQKRLNEEMKFRLSPGKMLHILNRDRTMTMANNEQNHSPRAMRNAHHPIVMINSVALQNSSMGQRNANLQGFEKIPNRMGTLPINESIKKIHISYQNNNVTPKTFHQYRPQVHFNISNNMIQR